MPLTPKRPVVDSYHGVAVSDDYRWLERGDDAEVRAWSEAQNRRARAVLDRLPSAAAIRQRVSALMKADSIEYSGLVRRGEWIFAVKRDTSKQQPTIVAMKSADGADGEHTLVDPNALDPNGGTSFDFFVPSLDGRFLAVSLSEGGAESGTVHCYDAATGRELGEPVPRVNGGTAGGSLAWNADATGFWYTRYPREGERPAEDLDFYQQVWFHAFGTPVAQDRYEIGREFPRIAEVRLATTDDGKWLLATVANGDGGEFAHWLRGPGAAWTQLTKFADKVVGAALGEDAALYLLSRKGAPRGRILRLPLATPRLEAAAEIVPESDVAIEWFVPTRTRLLVVDQVGGPNAVRVFDLTGRAASVLPIPPVSAVLDIVRLAGDDVLVQSSSFVAPTAWRRFRASDGTSAALALGKPSAVDYSDIEVVRETALSQDGKLVPMTILRRRGTKLDGSNPALLDGYGGYGINMSPYYSRVLRIWLDQGGVYALANTRGGGEFGEAWHLAGNLTHKQNVFDDFAACAKHLVSAGYTRPERLACEGGSNGGLLMGATFTQHPELCRAVVSEVGIYDMLRVETTPNGVFNITEFGTTADPPQFRALHAYSPYHHVADGASYPSILFMTGANDPRVDPFHSRKMTARLLAANASSNPVLLRTSASTGHGMGTPLDSRIEEQVDKYAFLFDALGVTFRE